MALIRAMAIFQGGSNLPEDRFINTFHFNTSELYAPHAVVVSNAIKAFYGTAALSVGSYLSPYVKRAYEVRTYDMTDDMPRVPTIFTANLGTAGAASSSIPEEVAVCLSYHGDPPVTGRRRGRLYLGPIWGGTTGADTNLPTRVSNALQGALTSAAQALKVFPNAGWSVYSPTGNVWTPITKGWVDNAFDTQRRRGPASTARMLWGT